MHDLLSTYWYNSVTYSIPWLMAAWNAGFFPWVSDFVGAVPRSEKTFPWQ